VLEIDEPIHIVPPGESGNLPPLVLGNATDEIVRHPHVKHAVGAGQDVHVVVVIHASTGVLVDVTADVEGT
jgi:hypothetical protein